MITAVTILSISIFMFIILSFVQGSKNSSLRAELQEAKDKINKLEKNVEQEKTSKSKIFSIDVGDNAIIKDYGLIMHKGSPNEVEFSVTYEVEITETSMDSVKVKPTNITSQDQIGRDPKNKKSIMDFLDGKWVKKTTIELIIDDKKRRNEKLSQLGIEE
jgi:lipopolysaccharide export LptBFGC system permease protein LptF